ncbi:Uncharacterised protein [Shigella flexneri]|nr:Uncharacterised protein [Shigella flexneri]
MPGATLARLLQLGQARQGRLIPHIRQIQQRIRFPQIVHLRASRNLKTHLLIEPNRLLILLINVGCQFRCHRERMLHQHPTHAAAAHIRIDKQRIHMLPT